ncbi:metallophosphoesterase [Bartonella sp. DGB1]|uniref:metallophosphoesterase family protein n=1 Tax=Bartonella sp. DGB1 TaxID=3239807 RepID=UPI0035269275
MIRFAHISDLHLSPIPKPTIMELLSKRLTGYINWKRNRENNYCNNIANAAILHLKQHNCQHLIISGDIVNIATNAEFLQAKQWLEKVDKTENISIVPGNHDAYIRGSLTKFSSIFSPWLKSDSDITQNTIYPYIIKEVI